MDRRSFLYKVTGGKVVIQSVIVWSVLISVTILVLKFDWSDDLNSFLNIVRLLGFLLAIISALAIAILIIAKIAESILPSNIIGWFKKNNKLINYIIIGFLLAYTIYRCYSKENYNLLIFPGIGLLWLGYLRWDERQAGEKRIK